MKKHIQIMAICFLSFLNITSINAQWWNLTGGNPLFGTEYIGANSGAFPLDIKHFSLYQPIYFHTTNTFGTLNTVQILPNFTGADLNVTDLNSGYSIASQYVLWHNGITSNIFLGVGAGNGGSGATGIHNTILGGNAGQAFLTGHDITFTGFSAGNANTTGEYNTFTGSNAGLVNTTGSKNTFLGMDAGAANTTADNNTFTGFQAGVYNTIGTENTYAGFRSGFGIPAGSTGSFNTFAGSRSGQGITTGSNNTFFGYQAGNAVTSTNFNTCIGYNSGQSSTASQSTFVGSQTGMVTSGTENHFCCHPLKNSH